MQKSVTKQDGSGSEVLEQLNNAFETLASSNSGGTEPQQTYSGMLWLDTSSTDSVLKQRNADNTGWATIGTIDEDGLFHPANTVASDDETVTKKATFSIRQINWCSLILKVNCQCWMAVY